MRTQTKYIQQNLTPKVALRILVEGNNRFIQNVKALRNLQDQVLETKNGEFPFAVILSCINSRIPVELVFDQGIGDIFSVRFAGNIVNEDVLGSLEYACKVAGSKIAVVMGHSRCGAVNAACNNIDLGNITSILSKIKPAVDTIKINKEEMSDNSIEEVAIQNVKLSIERIKNESPILFKMEKEGQIEIAGEMCYVESGKVEFDNF